MIADVPLGAVLVWVGALCNVVFPLPMIMATARGQQRPSRVSFFMWTTQACIAFAASAAAGADLGALLVTGSAAGVLAAVFVATFVPQLRGRHIEVDPAPRWQSRVDQLCLAVCVVALIGWWVTSNPLVALLLAIVTDAVAAVPTFIRGWRGEEDWLPYLGFAINAACSFVVITDWALAQWAFIYYQLVACTLLTLVPLLRNEPVARAGSRPLPLWGRAAASSGAALAILAATAVVTGVVARPTTAEPMTALNRAAAASADARVPAVRAVAIPSVSAAVPVMPTPGHIEISPDGRYALIAHQAPMAVSVFDTQSGVVTATIPTPEGPPQFVTFCPAPEDRATGSSGARAYISILDGAAEDPSTGQDRHILGVLDTARKEMVGVVPMSSRPYTAACSPDGRQLWVPHPDEGRIDVIDTASNLLVRSVPLPQTPHALAFSPDGSKVYAAHRDLDSIAVLDPSTAAVMSTIAVGVSPYSTALSPDGASLAVLDRTASEVSIIDTRREVEVKRLATGENPQDVVWSTDGRLVYTANIDGLINGDPTGTISAINIETEVHAQLPTGDLGSTNAPTSIALSADGATAYVTNEGSHTLAVYGLSQ